MINNSSNSNLQESRVQTEQSPGIVSLQELILWTAVSVLISVFFWMDLWLGWSFVGGDVYAYFMPQKFYYAQHLKEGVIPLWNNTTGHGYPILGESQTAALYPPNIVLYYFLDVVTAYNSSHLLHYVLAFLGTVLLALHWGYRREAAFFIALVFVYGWFPVKRCLEWAIITGAFLPWLLLCADLWLVEQKKRWLFGLSLLLGLQLLAGHYNLAFISLLALVGFGLSRSYGLMPQLNHKLHQGYIGGRPKLAGGLLVAIILGFCLAAIQLVPTIELKGHSQRRELTGDYQPAYGHLPLWYLEQCILPWKWYSKANLDQLLQEKNWLTSPAGTNQVEAHFYLGIIPLGLIIFAVWWQVITKDAWEWNSILLVMAALFLLLASGLLMPVLSNVPGFGYFTGPGRYSLVAQFCLAFVAGYGVHSLCKLLPSVLSVMLLVVISACTFVDFWWVTDSIYYTITVEHAPLERMSDSHVQKILHEEQQLPRVFGPSQNMLTLLGYSQTPTYLGIGPKEYWDEITALPKETLEYEQLVKQRGVIPGFEARQAWLQRAGVTHLVTFAPLDLTAWDCELITDAPDLFINAMVGRRRDPVYFYKLNHSRGRLSWLNAKTSEGIKLIKHMPQAVIVETEAAFEDVLVLTELDFPGWNVRVDGVKVTGTKIDKMFRGVPLRAGKHRVVWNYQPSSIFYGSCISISTLMFMLGYAVVCYRKCMKTRSER